MAWIHDSTKQIEVGIGEIGDKKWILIIGAALVLVYLLIKQGGKK